MFIFLYDFAAMSLPCILRRFKEIFAQAELSENFDIKIFSIEDFYITHCTNITFCFINLIKFYILTFGLSFVSVRYSAIFSGCKDVVGDVDLV